MDGEELADRFEDLHINIELPGTKVYRAEECIGTGLLKIDEHEVKWTGENGESVCLTYPEICLHAVSRDESSFPYPCLYMLTSPLTEEDPEAETEGEQPTETTEMRLVLQNTDDLEKLFDIISEGQALHPDPEDLSTDEEEEEGSAIVAQAYESLEEGAEFLRTEEDLQYLTPEGQRTLEHIERILASSEGQYPAQNGDTNGQFEDAED